MEKSLEKKVKVKQKENEEPVATEIIAQSIRRIADSVSKMNNAGLSGRAIRVLLQDASGENMTSIRNILNGLASLKKLYLNEGGKLWKP